MPLNRRRRDPCRDPSAAAWPWPSTSTTWCRRCGWPASCGPGSAWPRSGSSCSRAAGPEAVGSADRAGLRRVRRPQAARHPDHGRARRPGCSAPSALATSPCTPAATPTMLRAGVEGLPRGRAPAGLPDALPAGRHRAHQRRRTPRRTSSPAGWRWPPRAGCGGHRVRRRRPGRGPAARAPAARRRARHPARRARPSTTRPGPPPPPRPSRRRRPAGHRPGRHRRADDPVAAAAAGRSGGRRSSDRHRSAPTGPTGVRRRRLAAAALGFAPCRFRPHSPPNSARPPWKRPPRPAACGPS